MPGLYNTSFFLLLSLKFLLVALGLLGINGSFLFVNHVIGGGPNPDRHDPMAGAVGAMVPMGFICVLVAELCTFFSVFSRDLEHWSSTRTIVKGLSSTFALLGGRSNFKLQFSTIISS